MCRVYFIPINFAYTFSYYGNLNGFYLLTIFILQNEISSSIASFISIAFAGECKQQQYTLWQYYWCEHDIHEYVKQLNSNDK
jgi:hypothetical protein